MEFGDCGSTVILDQSMMKLKTLRVRFERIFEAAKVAQQRMNMTSQSMYVALLLSERTNIQWLLLFRSLEYLIDGRYMVGAHTVLHRFYSWQTITVDPVDHWKNNVDKKSLSKIYYFAPLGNSKKWALTHFDVRSLTLVGLSFEKTLWHQRSVIHRKIDQSSWTFMLLLVSDYSDLPLDCGDPPTTFSLEWITPETAVVLGAIEYKMEEKDFF
ncbi:unnamed protein product [Echinostoma caproni]|uniref:Retrovirus-related Pol polyprotein from transposon TNT 1-94 n=1 Tax=Echinostoma caproni TaxID=27848 RepID=A0A183AWB3_9TREM|nr:unnamed protein product [Echinostoma caproni]